MDYSQASPESTRIWMKFNKLRNDKVKSPFGKKLALESYVRNKLHTDKAHIADSILNYLRAKLNLRLPYGSGSAIISELRELLQDLQPSNSTLATSTSFGQPINQWVENTHNNSNSNSASIPSSCMSLPPDSLSALTVHNSLQNHLSDATTRIPCLTTASSKSVDSLPTPHDHIESPSSSKRGRCATHGSLHKSTSYAVAASKRARCSFEEDSYESVCPDVLEQQSCHSLFMTSRKMSRETTQALHVLTMQRLKLSSLMLQATIACPRQSEEKEPDMLELFRVAKDLTDRIVELSRYIKDRVDYVERL